MNIEFILELFFTVHLLEKFMNYLYSLLLKKSFPNRFLNYPLNVLLGRKVNDVDEPQHIVSNGSFVDNTNNNYNDDTMSVSSTRSNYNPRNPHSIPALYTGNNHGSNLCHLARNPVIGSGIDNNGARSRKLGLRQGNMGDIILPFKICEKFILKFQLPRSNFL